MHRDRGLLLLGYDIVLRGPEQPRARCAIEIASRNRLERQFLHSIERMPPVTCHGSLPLNMSARSMRPPSWHRLVRRGRGGSDRRHNLCESAWRAALWKLPRARCAARTFATYETCPWGMSSEASAPPLNLAPGLRRRGVDPGADIGCAVVDQEVVLGGEQGKRRRLSELDVADIAR